MFETAILKPYEISLSEILFVVNPPMNLSKVYFRAFAYLELFVPCGEKS
jgi:hypothetical protein